MSDELVAKTNAFINDVTQGDQIVETLKDALKDAQDLTRLLTQALKDLGDDNA